MRWLSVMGKGLRRRTTAVKLPGTWINASERELRARIRNSSTYWRVGHTHKSAAQCPPKMWIKSKTYYCTFTLPFGLGNSPHGSAQAYSTDLTYTLMVED